MKRVLIDFAIRSYDYRGNTQMTESTYVEINVSHQRIASFNRKFIIKFE